jgi:hypothetical protein
MKVGKGNTSNGYQHNVVLGINKDKEIIFVNCHHSENDELVYVFINRKKL